MIFFFCYHNIIICPFIVPLPPTATLRGPVRLFYCATSAAAVARYICYINIIFCSRGLYGVMTLHVHTIFLNKPILCTQVTRKAMSSHPDIFSEASATNYFVFGQIFLSCTRV